MAPVHTQQLARRSQTVFTKLTYSKLFANWLCVTSILTSTAAQANTNRISTYDELAPKNFLTNLFIMKQNKALEAVILANIFRHTDIEAAILARIFNQANKPVSKRSTT
jgi:hypothetical protein